jgi:hypothetical protein
MSNDTTVGGGEASRQKLEQLASQGLAWLADAPLFIDRAQVSAFYDAIVRPESALASISTSSGLVNEWRATLGGEAEASAAVSKLLKLFPFLDIEAKVKGELEGERARQKEAAETREYVPIINAERQLVQLALHYGVHFPERTVIVPEEGEAGFPGDEWWDLSFIRKVPRPLAFIDVPPRKTFIPFAAEVADGRVVLIFPTLVERYGGPGDVRPPKYPGSEGPVSQDPEVIEQEAQERAAYFGWFAERMAKRPNSATQVVEQVIAEGGGRVQWIDYRLPLGTPDYITLHMHVCGRGEFDTGVFAYNFIQRGFKHGLRIVGTLKSEPDLNVLAIFEK